MKTILLPLFTALLLASCASKPKTREDTEREYEKAETSNQIKSVQRADLMSRINAMESQIGELDQEILNQRNLITDYADQQETLPSARMMIDNAKVRIRNLEKEKRALLDFRNTMRADLDRVNAPGAD